MTTEIQVEFRLFDRNHKMELKKNFNTIPTVEEVIKLVMDKLHEAKDGLGETIKQEKREKDNVFGEIIFKSISIDSGNAMYLYRWQRKKFDHNNDHSQYGNFEVKFQRI